MIQTLLISTVTELLKDQVVDIVRKGLNGSQVNLDILEGNIRNGLGIGVSELLYKLDEMMSDGTIDESEFEELQKILEEL